MLTAPSRYTIASKSLADTLSATKPNANAAKAPDTDMTLTAPTAAPADRPCWVRWGIR